MYLIFSVVYFWGIEKKKVDQIMVIEIYEIIIYQESEIYQNRLFIFMIMQ